MVFPPMLKVWPAPRPLKAVSSSPTRDTAPPLPDPQGRDGRIDLFAVMDHDVNDVVVEFRDVTRTEVVPPPRWERWVEHFLKCQIRHGPTTVERRRPELFQWTHDLFALIDGTGIDGRDRDHLLAHELGRQAGEGRRC